MNSKLFSNQLSAGILAAMFCFVAGCASSTLQKPNLPMKFRVSSGGLFGDSFSIFLKEDHLVYIRRSPSPFGSKKINIRPTADQWQSFWDEMDKIDVWNWKANYSPSMLIHDGTQWHVEFSNVNREITASGDNAYPSDKSPAETTDNNESTRYERFRSAIERLTGQEFF